MAPYTAVVSHNSRDDGNGYGDGSDSIYNHPVIMFFGLLLLCFCIMAPMFWMLWMMRNHNRENVRTGQRLQRMRNWKRGNATRHLQHQATQQPIVQHGDETLVVNSLKNKLSDVFSNLLKVSTSAKRAVASQTQSLWHKISQRFTNSIHTASHRNRSHSRAGVSIDLPIMRQPAWQSLASGSVDITPSTTCGEATNHTSAEIEMIDMSGARGREQAEGSGARTGPGELGLHGVTDAANGAEVRMLHSASTVGLALG